jgi:SAM-dependent methyltransferase
MKTIRNIQNRYDFISKIPIGGVGAEVGVCHGSFSAMLLNRAKPKKLFLIDPWKSETDEFQCRQDVRFETVLQRFGSSIERGIVEVLREPSSSALERFTKNTFDWVVIDGSVEESDVERDIFGFYSKLRPWGLLIVAGASPKYPQSARYRYSKQLLEAEEESFLRAIIPGIGSAPYLVITKRPMLVKGCSGGGNMLGGDPATWEPDVWKYLVNTFNVRSALDVGCGEGHSARWFIDNGIASLGIDCLSQNVYSGVPGLRAFVDLDEGPFLTDGFDLAWCAEVAEHIEERNVLHLMNTLAQCRIVAMTHAPPGCHGHHHVNLRDDEYWIRLAGLVGLSFLQEATELARGVSRNKFFKRSGLVFENTFKARLWKQQ